MISIHTTEFIIGSIALVIAYVISVTIVGFGQAWTATRAGDDTPQEAGFLTFNPLVHVDLFGFICTILIGFGWGRMIPFHPQSIKGKHHMWRVLAVYLSQPLISLILALVALIMNVFLVGPQSLQFAFWNLFSKNIPLQQLTVMYPTTSSLMLVGVMILLSIIALNIFMATWSLINNAFHYLLFVGAEHGHDYMKHAEALAFFGPLVVLILFTGPLRMVLLRAMVILAYTIASLCGACS